MHRHIIHNHRLIEATKARLPALTSATLYGRGVFTTLAVYRGRPFLWPQHWARLAAHAAKVGVSLRGMTEENVRDSLSRVLAANEVEEGRARITLLAREAGNIWKGTSRKRAAVETDLLIMTGDARRVPEEGVALTLSPHRINSLSPLAGVKSLNYLDHLLAWEEARGREFDEAVRLNERGELVSATMANLFWLTQGMLYTPTLATGALAGTTRAGVIALAGELSVPHVEGVFELSHLAEADEIFLTSAGLGVAPVTAFDYHRYIAAAGSVALRLREAFRQLTFGEALKLTTEDMENTEGS